MSSSRNILVGVDGSDTSVAGLRWASALAAGGDAAVSALMVWNYPPAFMMPLVGAPVLPADEFAETARNRLRTIVAATDTAGVDVEEVVVMGAARAVLTDATDEEDLLVLGRTGNSRLRQIFLGSTVSYCVRHAECPVVIVRDSTAPEQQITVAVDGSPSSVEALVWALGLGEDNEVLAVYSHDEWELDELALDDDVRKDLDAKAHTMLTDAVREALAQSGADASRVKQQVRQGDPRTTLVDQADPQSMLVLGAQGHSGLSRWVLGSLADYAVQHAPGTVAVWR